MITFYNTLKKTKEPFRPLEEGRVKLYTCGPTVYNRAHIGNFRTFLFEDILKRYLTYRGFKVEHVMNITDVDDKTIRDSKKEGLPLSDFTKKYTEFFFEDMAFLGIIPADHFPRATGHIEEMLELIEMLDKNGYTYISDGSVYFSIAKFKNYGKLSGISLDQVKSGIRYDADEYEKDDIRDFVLWKGTRPGEPSWASAYGEGRPGWHIECSAMARKYLGDSIDIHCGGVDLVFPHHENEIAQSEAATGRPFARYFLHGAFLNLKKDKMAKSLGNMVSLADLRDQGFGSLAIRTMLLSAHYRSTLYFDLDELGQAKATVDRIQEALIRLGESKPGKTEKSISPILEDAKTELIKAMDDDLNIPVAFAAIFTFIKKLNIAIETKTLGQNDKQAAEGFLCDLDRIFGLFHREEQPWLDDEIERMIVERREARADKNFKRADEIRKHLSDIGIELIDSPEGTRFKRR